MDRWEQARQQRRLERELIDIIDHEKADMRPSMEWLKTLIPWIVTAAIFMWNSGGTWSVTAGEVAAAQRRVQELQVELHDSYVTKDDFKHVAEDVRDIKALLMKLDRK